MHTLAIKKSLNVSFLFFQDYDFDNICQDHWMERENTGRNTFIMKNIDLLKMQRYLYIFILWFLLPNFIYYIHKIFYLDNGGRIGEKIITEFLSSVEHSIMFFFLTVRFLSLLLRVLISQKEYYVPTQINFNILCMEWHKSGWIDRFCRFQWLL